MSDETEQKLHEAKAAELKLRAEVADAERECLASIAQGIPARVDNLAKKIASEQADVTRELGSDGVKDLRKKLGDAAAVIASEVDSAVDKIQWPRAREYSLIKSHDIHSALSSFLSGKHVNGLASIIKRAGFSIHEDNAQNAQFAVYPQHLYDQNGFSSLAEKLNELVAVERTLAEAKAKDDRDVVESLWADE